MDKMLSCYFTKVSDGRRIVTGIATAENLDFDGDIISFDASMQAFSDWIGNVREMHSPNAVGRVVDSRPVEFIYKGQPVRGIEVDVYISEAAEDTWMKIQEGILKGFSVGISKFSYDYRYDEDGNRIRYIDDFELSELSIVDNPANPSALVSMIKMNDKGDLVPVLNESEHSVFYCGKDNFAVLDNNICMECGVEMEKIGEVVEFNKEKIEKMIKQNQEGGLEKMSDLQKNDNDATISDSMKDEEFTEEQKTTILDGIKKFLGVSEEKSVETVVPNVVVNISPDVVSAGESESSDESLEKMVDKGDTETESDKEESVDMDAELIKSVLSEVLDEKLETLRSEVDEKIESIQKSVDSVKDEVSETKEGLEKVENSGAIQKSVDVEEDADTDDETIEKSVSSNEFTWGHIFVPESIIKARGYAS